MKRPATERLNYRHLEQDILSRVMNNDKNKLNKLLVFPLAVKIILLR